MMEDSSPVEGDVVRGLVIAVGLGDIGVFGTTQFRTLGRGDVVGMRTTYPGV
jgi:hypothetical protein